MKFQRLDLERFGHFRGPKLSFSAATSLLLVHGNNEAGKTTVLEAIRWLLFGGTGARWSIDDAPLAVGARVELSNGSVMEIRRTKGRGGGLRGSTAAGDEIDEEWILARLTRPNRVVFENVFGFSLDGLAQGAKALEHANLRNVIYGGGLGGTVHPDAILGDLRREADGLFTEKGRAQQIPIRAKRVDELRTRVKAVSTRADEWQHLQDDLDDRTASARRAADAWRVRREETDRLRAFAEAVAPLHRLDEARAELETLVVREALPLDAATKHAAWTSEREAHVGALTELDASIVSLEETLAHTLVDETVLGLDDEIVAVARELPRYLDDVAQRPLRSAELALLEQHARDQLRPLRPSWELDRLRAFQLDVVAHTEFEAVCAELDGVREELQRLTAALRQLDDDLSDNDAARATLPAAIEVAPLRAWLEAAGEIAAGRNSQGTLETRIGGLEKKRNALLSKLQPQPTAEVSAPPPAELTLFEDERAELDAERRRVDEQLRARRVEVDASAEHDDGHERVPTEDELVAARAERDQLLDQLLDQKPTASRVRTHARAVASADALADEMRAHADVVQRRALTAAARTRAQAALDRAERDGRALQLRMVDHDRRWQSAWIGLTPRAPAAMRTWIDQRDQLSLLDEELREDRSRLLALTDRITAWATRGGALLGEGTVDELRSIAAERVSIEEKRVAELRALDRTRARDLSRRLTLEGELAGAARRDEAARGRLPALLKALGLEDDLSPSAARALLTGLARARTELVSGEATLRAQVSRLDVVIDRYEERAAALLLRAGEEGAIDAVIPALEGRRVAAREAQRARDEAARAHVEQSAKRVRVRSALDTVNGHLDSLFSAAAARSEAELLAAFAARVRHGVLTQQIDGDERLLTTLRGELDRETFAASVRGLDGAAARATLAAAADEGTRLEQEMLTQQRAVGDATARLRSIDGRQDAAEALAALESERAALHEDVERYAVLMLSDALLRGAIERFERENQPALLHRASMVFASMTGGRFSAIRKAGDGLVVERANGAEVSPDHLSTGTREQLYLAIRLAYVEHYCASAEPLPVVLDDVLVNFDDQRARATLEALASFSKTTQVILFTCHQSTLALAAAVNAQTLEIPTI